MRSFTSTLLFEALFDALPTTNPDVTSLAETIFNPSVNVVTQDCNTSLGESTAVNFSIQGKTELATGLLITEDRVNELLTTGTYFVNTRSTSTCIAKGGVCLNCLKASRPYSTNSVGDMVRLLPEYEFHVDVLTANSGTSVQLTLDSSMYDVLYVFYNNSFIPVSGYSVLDDVLTFTTPLPPLSQVVVKYVQWSRVPFLYWLAGTYSGSMLGMSPLPSQKLTLRPELLASLVPESKVEFMIDNLSDIPTVPQDYLSYLKTITGKLEKALYLLSIYGIYLNTI